MVGRRNILDRLRLRRRHRGDERHLAVGRHVLERQRYERARGDVRPWLVEEDDQLAVDDVADARGVGDDRRDIARRSEEHTSELQSLMRISYAVFCLKKKTKIGTIQ